VRRAAPVGAALGNTILSATSGMRTLTITRRRATDMRYEDFLNTAAEVGFTELQAQFMWDFLAKAYHTHYSYEIKEDED
jgi:uncharacterized protein (DUF2164 family)